MTKNPFDAPYGTGKSEYERYLRTDELLGLQKPAATRTHPDELLFQSVHQVEELWMKVGIHAVGAAVVALEADDWALARTRLDRTARSQEQCRLALMMFETMAPTAYLEVRRGLGRGSGMDSPGYKRFSEVLNELWNVFAATLERNRVDLLEVYQQPDEHAAVFAVAEAMVTIDAQMMRFKREHMMVVRRILGAGTASLRGGNPMDMLNRSAERSHFPLLWAIRERLFMDFQGGELAV